MKREVELKFLVHGSGVVDRILERGTLISDAVISQNYLSVRNNLEIRLRSMSICGYVDTVSYYLTVKSGGTLERLESEHSITKEEYSRLLSSINETAITKRRLTVQYDEYVLEIDIFNKIDLDLILLEVEIPDDTHVPTVVYLLSEFNVTDVTSNKAYKNKNIWARLNSKG